MSDDKPLLLVGRKVVKTGELVAESAVLAELEAAPRGIVGILRRVQTAAAAGIVHVPARVVVAGIPCIPEIAVPAADMGAGQV